ncbi:YidB family protein [Mesorhizobium sp. BR1-1-2]|uniref:YidB family protein n=1 Tax=Mesorhizobium sp. BR1-1-2 TaxID=2876652 RepID=UPI001CCD5F5A|nr:YidB family protein [Mesorhizobium sp. BR1-1-2]MBZ9962945.1 YidB family protein [Mesorhizobium sp. BR1-1-2]
MGLFDNAVPGGNITKPLMIALGALLVGKMLSGRSAEQPEQAQAPVPAEPSEATAGDGGLLGGLGGLLDKLKNSGHGNVADSWVGTGQNQPINPNDLGNAIGPQVIREIAQRTGLDEQELLKQLSAALPGIVDKLTPNGQVPQQHQVASAFNS